MMRYHYFMLTKLISWFLWLFNFLICSTLKYKVTNEPAGQSLFAIWHGQSFPLFYWAQHRKLCLLPIETWRGEILAYLAKKYGYRTVRIQEKGTPLERSKSVSELLSVIKEGAEAAIAIDGPPKPIIYHKAKSGILYLSWKTSLPVVPVGIRMKKKITFFWRWDRYEVPLPGSEVEIKFGKPFLANEKTTTPELEELLSRLSEGPQSAAG